MIRGQLNCGKKSMMFQREDKRLECIAGPRCFASLKCIKEVGSRSFRPLEGKRPDRIRIDRSGHRKESVPTGSGLFVQAAGRKASRPDTDCSFRPPEGKRPDRIPIDRSGHWKASVPIRYGLFIQAAGRQASQPDTN